MQMQKRKHTQIHYLTCIPTNRDVDVQNISTEMKMHDIWLDTAITPLEVISVSTPQNNDDACPGSQIYMCKYNTNHNMYKKSNTLKMLGKIWTEPHGKLGDADTQGIPTYT